MYKYAFDEVEHNLIEVIHRPEKKRYTEGVISPNKMMQQIEIAWFCK